MAQSVACNRLHPINERCARWLLMTRDRVGRETFELTQEYLALMLGANRPSVSIAASTLQHAGLISYKRGLISVVDGEGLEDVSCECYESLAIALHHINERCARWLLTCEDRVGRATFELTQEFLATMIGSSRPSVSAAASALQEAGLIKYARGVLSIRDREGLENASCECYAVTTAQIQRVLPIMPVPESLLLGAMPVSPPSPTGINEFSWSWASHEFR